jgi:hypothetical protein
MTLTLLLRIREKWTAMHCLLATVCLLILRQNCSLLMVSMKTLYGHQSPQIRSMRLTLAMLVLHWSKSSYMHTYTQHVQRTLALFVYMLSSAIRVLCLLSNARWFGSQACVSWACTISSVSLTCGCLCLCLCLCLHCRYTL